MQDEILQIQGLSVNILTDDQSIDNSKNDSKDSYQKGEQGIEANGKKGIIHDLSLTIKKGEIHALMGPNGSGKSTLSNAIMGHPSYEITRGKIIFKGQDITKLPTYERARLGIFMSFQHPVSLPGVSLTNFLRTAVNSIRGEMSVKEFRLLFKAKMAELKIDPSFTRRYVNEGFSGGEKKRFEILQLSMLEPALSILDEIDSGLDIDALRIVSEGINSQIEKEMSILLITHYQRILDVVKPHFVHIFAGGRILKTGGPDLALKLEKEGYDWILKESQTT